MAQAFDGESPRSAEADLAVAGSLLGVVDAVRDQLMAMSCWCGHEKPCWNGSDRVEPEDLDSLCVPARAAVLATMLAEELETLGEICVADLLASAPKEPLQ